ncbi:MAG: hypothetical protein ACRDQ0_07470, partial [Pseudonocardia sp.]
MSTWGQFPNAEGMECPCRGGATDLQSKATAVARYEGGSAHARWNRETGIFLQEPYARAYEAAMADGETSSREQEHLDQLIGGLSPRDRGRLARNATAYTDVALGNAVSPRRTEDIERLLAEDKALVHAYNPDYRYDNTCFAPAPTEAERQVAKENIERLQSQQKGIVDRLNGMQPELEAFGRRQAAYEDQVAAYNAGLGGDHAWLQNEKRALQAEADRLNAGRQGVMAELGRAQDALHDVDMAAADIAGDPALAAQLRLADRNADAVRGFVGTLTATPTTPAEVDRAIRLAEFARGIQVGYDLTVVAPRMPSRLNDMQLPSTGAGDMIDAFSSSINRPSYMNAQGDIGVHFRRLGNSTSTADRDLLANMAVSGKADMYIGHQFTSQVVASSDIPAKTLARMNAERRKPGAPVERVQMLYMPAEDGAKQIDDSWVTLYRMEKAGGGFVYVDHVVAEDTRRIAGRYAGLEDFIWYNESFPDDGKLVHAQGLHVAPGDRVELVTSPAHRTATWKKVGRAVSLVGAVAGAAVVTVGTGGVAAVGWGLIGVSAAASSVEAGENLYQRARHGQSNDFVESASARNSMLTLAGNVFMVGGMVAPLRAAVATFSARQAVRGAATAVETRFAARAVRRANRLNSAERPLSSTLNWTGAATFGYQFGEGAYTTWRDWDRMSPHQRHEAVNGLVLNAAMMGVPAGARLGAARARNEPTPSVTGALSRLTHGAGTAARGVGRLAAASWRGIGHLVTAPVRGIRATGGPTASVARLQNPSARPRSGVPDGASPRDVTADVVLGEYHR